MRLISICVVLVCGCLMIAVGIASMDEFSRNEAEDVVQFGMGVVVTGLVLLVFEFLAGSLLKFLKSRKQPEA